MKVRQVRFWRNVGASLCLLVPLAAPANVPAASEAAAPATVPPASETAAPVQSDRSGAAVQALTAEQIVEKNVAARGGLDAWRAVHSMTVSGEFEASSSLRSPHRFVLKLKRPRKTWLEVDMGGSTAIEAFDGTSGWKVRPFIGQTGPVPYSLIEKGKALEQQDLDGPLIDHEAKGIRVELEGTESVHGHDTYRLKLTMKDGRVRHTWIDTASFLEVKRAINPRLIDGTAHPTEEYYRNYRSVQGLLIPFDVRTVVEGSTMEARRMVVDRVVLNPAIDDQAFEKPAAPAKVVMDRHPGPDRRRAPASSPSARSAASSDSVH